MLRSGSARCDPQPVRHRVDRSPELTLPVTALERAPGFLSRRLCLLVEEIAVGPTGASGRRALREIGWSAVDQALHPLLAHQRRLPLLKSLRNAATVSVAIAALSNLNQPLVLFTTYLLASLPWPDNQAGFGALHSFA
jgi:hypothetical protein